MDRRRSDDDARKRAEYLDEVFGDVLPSVTSDEAASPDRSGDVGDDWYLENRPPHHDRD